MALYWAMIGPPPGPESDPMDNSLESAAVDDEPVTPEEEREIEEARQELVGKLLGLHFSRSNTGGTTPAAR